MQDRGDASAKKPRVFLLVHAKVTSLFHPSPPRRHQWQGNRRGLFEVSLACRRIQPSPFGFPHSLDDGDSAVRIRSQIVQTFWE